MGTDVRTAPPVARRPPSRPRRWWWVAGWIAATICVAIFLRTFDLRAAVARIARADPGWITLAVLANFAVLPVMTEQWALLLPRGTRVRWRVLWECLTLSMASMNTLPFGGGHAVAAGVLSGRGVTDLEGAVSLLALEQLCEGVSRVVLLLVAVAAAPLPPVLRQLAWFLPIAVVAGYLAMFWLASHPPEHGAAPGWRARWGRHLDVVRRPRIFLRAVSLSLAMKLLALAGVYAVQRSLGVQLPLADAPLVLAAVVFATSMSLAPGNVGMYELAAIAAYRLLGVSAGDAAALALVLHATFLLPTIGTGYAVTLWRTVKPQERWEASKLRK